MDNTAEADVLAEKDFGSVSNLLGGAQVLHRPLSNGLDAHDMILNGLPAAALDHLVGRLAILRDPGLLEKAIGMSIRTMQRRREKPDKPLSQEQSGRAWTFVEILSKATAVLGSLEEAEQWMVRPAIGLEQRRPIDLLATPAGVEIVETFLERLEYGVYA